MAVVQVLVTALMALAGVLVFAVMCVVSVLAPGLVVWVTSRWRRGPERTPPQ